MGAGFIFFNAIWKNIYVIKGRSLGMEWRRAFSLKCDTLIRSAVVTFISIDIVRGRIFNYLGWFFNDFLMM